MVTDFDQITLLKINDRCILKLWNSLRTHVCVQHEIIFPPDKCAFEFILNNAFYMFNYTEKIELLLQNCNSNIKNLFENNLLNIKNNDELIDALRFLGFELQEYLSDVLTQCEVLVFKHV